MRECKRKAKAPDTDNDRTARAKVRWLPRHTFPLV